MRTMDLTSAALETISMKESRGGALAREDEVIDSIKSKVDTAAKANTFGNFGAPDTGSDAATGAKSNLLRALRVSESTNEMGYATIQELGRQKETIGRSIGSVDETHNELRDARQTIHNIRMSVYKEWAVKGFVIVSLLLMDMLIFYAKFIRK